MRCKAADAQACPSVEEHKTARKRALWRRRVRGEVRASMKWSQLVAAALLSTLVLATRSAEAGGYFVQVVWCGGQTYRIRESGGSAEATVDPRRVTTTHTNDLATSQRRIAVDRKLAWGSSLHARSVPGAQMLDWADRPSGEPLEVVGLRVVYVPSLADVPSMSGLATDLRGDPGVSILITDISDYGRAVALISAVRPRVAIVATNPHEAGSKALLAKYPAVSTVRTGETRQGVSVTNNEAFIAFGWGARVPPLAVLSPPSVRCEGIASDGSAIEDGGIMDAGAPSAPSADASPAPVLSTPAVGASRDRDAPQRESTSCRCEAPGGHRRSAWACVAGSILGALLLRIRGRER